MGILGNILRGFGKAISDCIEYHKRNAWQKKEEQARVARISKDAEYQEIGRLKGQEHFKDIQDRKREQQKYWENITNCTRKANPGKFLLFGG
jgi:hypothetical protein